MPGVPDSPAPGFKDHFSRLSSGYARHRPLYPETLFAFLATLPAARGTAWDCGTGSGQAALALSSAFAATVATDASRSQVARARRGPGILYAAAAAEKAPLRNGSIDLVTVAQALHWFDFGRFFAEVERVARPGAALAAWAYGNCRVSPAVDAVYDRLYRDILGDYWPPERSHIEDGYRSIPFPFPPIPAPAFVMKTEWDLEAFLAYLGTWSGVQKYREARGADPLALIRPAMAEAWEELARVRTVSWPLILHASRVGD